MFLRCIESDKNASEEALTWLSLLDEFGRKSEDGKQLPNGLHDGLRHSGCVRDLGIDPEVFQHRLNRLEQINKRIECANVLDSLKHLDVRKIRTWERDIQRVG